jgi:hypothetical protein
MYKWKLNYLPSLFGRGANYTTCTNYYFSSLSFTNLKLDAIAFLIFLVALEPHPLAPPPTFALVIIQVWVSVFARGQLQTDSLLHMTSQVVGIIGLSHHALPCFLTLKFCSSFMLELQFALTKPTLLDEYTLLQGHWSYELCPVLWPVPTGDINKNEGQGKITLLNVPCSPRSIL